MTEKTEVEIWIVIDADGDYAVGADEDQAIEDFNENVGNSGGPRRIVKLTARMTLPVIDEAEIDIPDTAGTTEKIEVEAA